MLNSQQIQSNWPQIKSQVLSKWNKLSEADVEKTQGNVSTLGSLVQKKYGNSEDFNKTYEKMCESCIPSSRNVSQAQADGVPDFENRSKSAPAAAAGIHNEGTESVDDTHFSGSPERRADANYAKVNNTENFSREMDEETSAYSADSRTSVDTEEAGKSHNTDEFNFNNDTESNTHFTTPDEFTPSQDPSPSREDITLGRNTSSATKISTAKAAPISSEVSSNDA